MSEQLRVLLLGAQGQLGQALRASPPPGIKLSCRDRSQLDIRDAAEVDRQIGTLGTGLVINAAAYTQVDQAEQDPDTAFAINARGPANIARACARHQCWLIHVSTDFVFDGESAHPYSPDAATRPINTYGASKLEGEQQVRKLLPEQHHILRTAWLYDGRGRNFVHTMLRLMCQGRDLRVVSDQFGTPTWAAGLAEAIWSLWQKGCAADTWHWTDAGTASWYDFAVAIQREALELGQVPAPVRIDPIATAAYPTPARRPAFSVLDKTSTWQCLGRPAPHWQQQLRKMLAHHGFNL